MSIWICFSHFYFWALSLIPASSKSLFWWTFHLFNENRARMWCFGADDDLFVHVHSPSTGNSNCIVLCCLEKVHEMIKIVGVCRSFISCLVLLLYLLKWPLYWDEGSKCLTALLWGDWLYLHHIFGCMLRWGLFQRLKEYVWVKVIEKMFGSYFLDRLSQLHFLERQYKHKHLLIYIPIHTLISANTCTHTLFMRTSTIDWTDRALLWYSGLPLKR